MGCTYYLANFHVIIIAITTHKMHDKSVIFMIFFVTASSVARQI